MSLLGPGSWRPVIERPPEGVPLDVKIHDAKGIHFEAVMTFAHNQWWYDYGTPDAIYVYFRPTHWRTR